ncbi:MAG: zinc ribbon domain-containing protein [Bacteroidetes bacterium]|nr:zinc ribbon domain-containing protein [Bacteroidota bacterium]
MHCYRCQTENEPGAHYCKHCGADLWQAPEPAKAETYHRDLMHVLIIMGWEYLTYFIWMLVPFLMRIGSFSSGGYRSVNKLYLFMNLFTGGITLALTITFAVLARNRVGRIILIVFAVLRLISMAVYMKNFW